MSGIPLSFGAEQLLAAIGKKKGEAGAKSWLHALLQHDPDLVRQVGGAVDADALLIRIERQLSAGDAGTPLGRAQIEVLAREQARVSGHPIVTPADLATVILGAARTADDGSWTATVPAEPLAAYEPKATRPTPTLDEFGQDLTAVALAGELTPIIGRDREIRLIEEIICRRTKRNPALVGPAGTGKTAIVEGLAQRIVRGTVPELLRNTRIIALQPSSVTAGAGVVGALEERMKAILDEASQDGIILFIDEMHTMVGSGGVRGVGDVGALLKPKLARGDISVIGATTDDEYREFIEHDSALERRFGRVPVQEMSPDDTMAVMSAHRDKLAQVRGVSTPDVVLDWLIDFADQYLRNRHFPDKAIDLLENCVANVVVDGGSEVTLEVARGVAERMVGLPIDLNVRLAELEHRLVDEGLLLDEDAEELTHRVAITMQGLDVRQSRPNVTMLLLGESASMAESVCSAIAETLFGAAGRVVEIDFGQLDDSEDLNTLVGPPPGYIGFGGRLPLDEVAQMPWCVVYGMNVDGCHPAVADVLAQALADGVVTQRSGRRIYLSDAVVLLTAATGAITKRTPGFELPGTAQRADSPTRAARAVAEELLGVGLTRQIDIIYSTVPEVEASQRQWIQQVLLAQFVERYHQRGIELEWDDAFIDRVVQQLAERTSRTDLIRTIEDELGDVLLPVLPTPGEGARSVRVTVTEGEPTAEVRPNARPD